VVIASGGGTATINGLTDGTDYHFQIWEYRNSPVVNCYNAGPTTNSTTIVANLPPIVDAGSDQQINLPVNSVTLNGTASDTDGSIISILWTQISGPTTATLNNPDMETATATNLDVGVYQFRITVTDDLGAVSFDDVLVTVDPELPVMTLADVSIMDPTGCGTDDGSITVNSITPGAVSDHTFELFDAIGNSLGIGGPVFNNLSPGNHTIVATSNINGFSGPPLAFTLSSPPLPVIAVNDQQNNSSCINPNGSIDITINGTADPASFTINWFEGIDNTGPLVDTDVTSISGLTSGDYFVEVEETATFCMASQLISLTDIRQFPVLNIQTLDNTSCNNVSPNGTITVDVTGSGTTYSYQLTGAATITRDNVSASETFQDLPIGTYSVMVTDDQNGCEATQGSIQIGDISAPPAVTVGLSSSTACSGETVSITANGADTYELFINDVSAGSNDTGLFDFETTDADVGSNEIRIVGEASVECFTEVMENLQVNQTPNVNFELSDNMVCADDDPIFINVEASGGTLSVNGTPISGTSISPADFPTGINTVRYERDNGNCSDFLEQVFTIAPTPDAGFIFLEKIVINEEAVFQSAGNADSYEWKFGDGITSNDANPAITYKKPGTKTVELTVILGECTNSSSMEIFVQRFPVAFNNVITPNGDGYNDILFIQDITSFENVEVKILNRWGIQVFSNKNYNNVDVVWKGEVDGKLAPPGNYLCIIKANNNIIKETISLVR
jgi:gliding motility-associated-like protein